MNKTFQFITAVLFVPLFFSSCKQEGCTDPFAINYDAEAGKDNGTCVFEGRVVIWFTSVTATNLVNASIPEVDIKINGIMEGSMGMTQFSIYEPPCGSNEGYMATVDMDKLGSQTLPYVIYEGGTSNIIQSGNVVVNSNQCQWIELTY